MKPTLSTDEFQRLRALDTCTVSNAIETFNVRLRNEGFMRNTVSCRFPQFGPMLGYAATASIRSSTPPPDGRCYYDRVDWWHYIASVPAPRVLVLRDADHDPGLGAFVGEIHAHICLALQCLGCVTDGAVRDLDQVEATGFHLFSRNVSVSHSYAHVVEFGKPVEIGGLKIHSGDLIHGDRNGVHSIPLSIARDVPVAAAQILTRERELILFSQSTQFNLGRLEGRLRHEPCGADGYEINRKK